MAEELLDQVDRGAGVEELSCLVYDRNAMQGMDLKGVVFREREVFAMIDRAR